jgi:hypothetical protein
MAYLVNSKIKKFFHENGKNLSADGLHALEVKLVECMEKCCKEHDGGHKTVDARLVNQFKM